jgi:hypothetical protein
MTSRPDNDNSAKRCGKFLICRFNCRSARDAKLPIIALFRLSAAASQEVRGMKTLMRGALSIVLAALAPIFAATAQTPPQSLKDQLVGHWQLVSVSVNGTTPYGDKPQGAMFLDAGGHYSVIVNTAGQARSIAYFGTYTVNDADSTLTMHIDSSNRPGAVGRDQKRLVSFSTGNLVIGSAKTNGPLGGVKLTWKQAN